VPSAPSPERPASPAPGAATGDLRFWFAPGVRRVTGPLLAATAAFSVHLWPEWSHNPDLSHGFFAPVVFVLLLLAAALLGAVFAALLAASVGWSHALVNFVLAAALVALLLAGLVALADERVRLVPFNWAAVVACGLWLLATPIPEGTYARLTLHLQTSVTTGVINLLHLLGIPAQQQGNIIVLARTVVGVEEACSGVRSLISCFYVGVFLSAWKLRRAVPRTGLILLAPVLAIVMNYIRSASLTLMANAGVDISGFWHDATGFAILGLTTVMLTALALWLAPPDRTDPPPAPAESPRGVGSITAFLAGAGLLACFGLAILALSLRPADASAPARPVLGLLPATAPGWEVRTTEDLYQFSAILRTEHLAERTYTQVRNGEPVQLNIYIAYWPAGTAPVSLVASHTPDACWPGAGWVAESIPNPRPRLAAPDGQLPLAEHRVFKTMRGYHQHVWFWHLYNGRAINYRDPYSVPALLEIALRYGFSREGPQYFIRVSSNRPWEDLAGDPLLREILANLRPLGLAP